MNKLIRVAAAEIGEEEIPGSEHNERILQYADECGLSWIDDDETPWCSVFVNWIAQKAGLECSGKANARSWLTVGRRVMEPEPGDVAVFWRGSRESRLGHVGLFMGYSADSDHIYVLGGNQDNQVGIRPYGAERLLGFRRLRPDGEIDLPEPLLERGDRSPAVARLQEALKQAGFEAGPTDGIYGPMTERAVKDLQATSEDLTIDGIYGENARAYLLELLGDHG